jgi:hypothetical protein
VSLGLRQAEALLQMLGCETDARTVSERFDAWCIDNIQPWYEDHVHWDASLLSRFAGADIDVEGRLSSDVLCAAGAVEPALMPVVGPYLGMMALPSSLVAVEERVRELLRSGWRPPYAAGSSRDDLVGLLRTQAAVG